MWLYKEAPEMGLSAEVDHQTSLFIDTHAGWVQRPCKKNTQKHHTPDLKWTLNDSRITKCDF